MLNSGIPHALAFALVTSVFASYRVYGPGWLNESDTTPVLNIQSGPLRIVTLCYPPEDLSREPSKLLERTTTGIRSFISIENKRNALYFIIGDMTRFRILRQS